MALHERSIANCSFNCRAFLRNLWFDTCAEFNLRRKLCIVSSPHSFRKCLHTVSKARVFTSIYLWSDLVYEHSTHE